MSSLYFMQESLMEQFDKKLAFWWTIFSWFIRMISPTIRDGEIPYIYYTFCNTQVTIQKLCIHIDIVLCDEWILE